MGPLNKMQRGICVAAAGAIAIGVIVQANSNGMDETPWMLGIVAIAALLFIATIGMRSRSAPKPSAASSEALSLRIVPAFKDAREQFLSFLRTRVREIAPSELDDGQAAILNQMQTMMQHHFEATACVAAFMLVYLAAHKSDADFASSPALRTLKLAAANAFVIATTTGIMKAGKTQSEAHKLALASAPKVFAKCEMATNLCIANFATKRADPLDPAFILIDGDVALAKATRGTLEATYGDVSRRIMSGALSGISGFAPAQVR